MGEVSYYPLVSESYSNNPLLYLRQLILEEKVMGLKSVDLITLISTALEKAENLNLEKVVDGGETMVFKMWNAQADYLRLALECFARLDLLYRLMDNGDIEGAQIAMQVISPGTSSSKEWIEKVVLADIYGEDYGEDSTTPIEYNEDHKDSYNEWLEAYKRDGCVSLQHFLDANEYLVHLMSKRLPNKEEYKVSDSESVLFVDGHGGLVDSPESTQLTFRCNDFVDSLVLMGWPGNEIYVQTVNNTVVYEANTKEIIFSPHFTTCPRNKPYLDRRIYLESLFLGGKDVLPQELKDTEILVSQLYAFMTKQNILTGEKLKLIKKIQINTCAGGRKLPRVPLVEAQRLMEFLEKRFPVGSKRQADQITETDEKKRIEEANILFLENMLLIDKDREETKNVNIIETWNSKYFTEFLKLYNIQKVVRVRLYKDALKLLGTSAGGGGRATSSASLGLAAALGLGITLVFSIAGGVVNQAWVA